MGEEEKNILAYMLGKIPAIAAENGCERCELEVNVANTPAVELYKKCGYDIAGTRPNFYRRTRYSTRDAYTMVLQLSK